MGGWGPRELLSRSRNTVSRGHVTPQVDAFLAQADRRLLEEALDVLSADIDAAAAEARPALSARLRESQPWFSAVVGTLGEGRGVSD